MKFVSEINRSCSDFTYKCDRPIVDIILKMGCAFEIQRIPATYEA